MKKQLLKKLASFFVTAMLFSASANAQIIYTNVNPDILQTCQTFQCSKTSNLDMNNDGVSDLTLDLILSTTTRPTPPFLQYFNGYVRASPLNGSSIITNGSGYPLKLNQNGVIDSSGSWSNIANQLLISNSYTGVTYVLTSSTGNWTNTINGFLGIQIVSGTQNYYGWVRLSIDVDVTPTIGSFKIIDYAYNSIPNQPILAGQTVATGIVENSFASAISIYPNPAKDQFTIEFGSSSQNVDVTIIDLAGKAIFTSTTNEANKLVVNTAEFAEGIYMVKIQSGESVATKKLIIQ